MYTKKQELLKAIYNADGNRRLQYGSYAKIAKEINVSDTYVRQCLNPNAPEWSVRVFRCALTLLKAQAQEEKKLTDHIAEVIAAIEK